MLPARSKDVTPSSAAFERTILPSSAASSETSSDGDDAIRCPGCRTVYPADRTHCQRCGTWLRESSAAEPAAASVRVPVPPTTLAPFVPPTMRGPQRTSSRRALFTAVGVGTALGLITLFVGTAVFDSGDGPGGSTRTGSAPDGAAEVIGAGAEATQVPSEPVTAAVDPTPEPVIETPEPLVATPPPAATPEPVPATAAPPVVTPVAIAVDEPPDEAEPVSGSTPEPTAALVLERVDRAEVLTPRDLEPIEPADDGRVNRLDTWICEGDVRFEGPASSAWEVERIDFSILDGKERVAINLRRTGPGDGQPVTLTAQRFHSDFIRRFAPGAAQPASGRFTIGILLTPGVKDDLQLRSYRPSGTSVVKEVSSYKAPGPSTRIVTTVRGQGCFRLQVPAWTGPNAENVKKARILLDIRP